MRQINTTSITSCSSSTSFTNHDCGNIYNGKQDVWWAKYSDSNDAWVKIQFNRSIVLARIEIQQPPYPGYFKRANLSFSVGPPVTIDLENVALKWKYIRLEGNSTTSFLKIEALEYYDSAGWYGIETIVLWELLQGKCIGMKKQNSIQLYLDSL